MADREKLIELIEAVPGTMFYVQEKPYEMLAPTSTQIADHLIANGVTVQKWVSVKDRLPEDPLQTVLVTNGKETCVAVYSVVYDEFGVMCGRGQDKRFGVTHWMPLPQPPKGDKL